MIAFYIFLMLYLLISLGGLMLLNYYHVGTEYMNPYVERPVFRNYIPEKESNRDDEIYEKMLAMNTLNAQEEIFFEYLEDNQNQSKQSQVFKESNRRQGVDDDDENDDWENGWGVFDPPIDFPKEDYHWWYRRRGVALHWDALKGDKNCRELRAKTKKEKYSFRYSDKLDVAICMNRTTEMETMYRINSSNTLSVQSFEKVWVAHKLNKTNFKIFATLDNKSRPTKFQLNWSAVIVVKRGVKIEKPMDFRYKRVCFPDIADYPGYKVAIYLLKRLVLFFETTTVYSEHEHDLFSLHNFFSKACLPGRWHNLTYREIYLKEQYKNLCEICENNCTAKDKYAGHRGVLRCLTEGKGEVGFTTFTEVMKFFNIKPASKRKFQIPLETRASAWSIQFLADNFSLYNVNRLTDENTVTWIQKPGHVLVASNDPHTISMLDGLEKYHFSFLLKYSSQDWYKNFFKLLPNEKIKFFWPPLSTEELINWGGNRSYSQFLEYTGVLYENTRYKMCVASENAYEQCLTLQLTAQSRGVRPNFKCIRYASEEKCVRQLKNYYMTIITTEELGPILLKNIRFRAVLFYRYEKHPAVVLAVVRTDSYYKRFSDLKGARSCHAFYSPMAMHFGGVVYRMLMLGLIEFPACPVPAQGYTYSQFFSNGSCIPDAIQGELKIVNANGGKHPRNFTGAALCSQCVDSCLLNNKPERFTHQKGAFRCLASGHGDVAFLYHDIVEKFTGNTTSSYKWTRKLNISEYEILCPRGRIGRTHITDYSNCKVVYNPKSVIATGLDVLPGKRQDIRNLFLTFVSMFPKNSTTYRFFGKNYINRMGENSTNNFFPDNVNDFYLCDDSDSDLYKFYNIYKQMRRLLGECKNVTEKRPTTAPAVQIC